MKMKTVVLALALSLCMIRQAEAAMLPENVEDIVPQQAEAIVEDIMGNAAGVPELTEGLTRLWDKGRSLLGETAKTSAGSMVAMLCVVLLCALAEDCLQAAGNNRVINMVGIAGAVSITLIAAGNLDALIGLGVETMEELNVFSKALLPTLSAAVAAGGGVILASVRQVAAVFFSDILISLIRQILLPLVYAHIAAAMAGSILPEKRLQHVSRAISKGTTWVLSGVLVLYTGYLTLAGVAAGSADTLSVQVTRTAMNAVPVVGSIISDAAATVLMGAATMKNTIGIVGMRSVLAVCLGPCLELVVHYLLYKVTSFVAGMMGSSSLVELIDTLGGTFGLVLGMTGACALVLLISIMTSVTVVMT